MSDDYNCAVREHGGGVKVDPLKNASGPIHEYSVEEAAAIEHGGGGVKVDPLKNAHGPIHEYSVEEATAIEFGMGAVKADPMVKHGTRDEEILKNINILKTASDVTNLRDLMSSIPDKAILEVISYRYKKFSNIVDDRGFAYSKKAKEELETVLGLDLAIIEEAMKEERDLSEIDTAIYVGQNEHKNADELLDTYKDKLNNSGVNITITDKKGVEKDAIEVIENMREGTSKDLEERGYAR